MPGSLRSAQFAVHENTNEIPENIDDIHESINDIPKNIDDISRNIVGEREREHYRPENWGGELHSTQSGAYLKIP